MWGREGRWRVKGRRGGAGREGVGEGRRGGEGQGYREGVLF